MNEAQAQAQAHEAAVAEGDTSGPVQGGEDDVTQGEEDDVTVGEETSTSAPEVGALVPLQIQVMDVEDDLDEIEGGSKNGMSSSEFVLSAVHLLDTVASAEVALNELKASTEPVTEEEVAAAMQKLTESKQAVVAAAQKLKQHRQNSSGNPSDEAVMPQPVEEETREAGENAGIKSNGLDDTKNEANVAEDSDNGLDNTKNQEKVAPEDSEAKDNTEGSDDPGAFSDAANSSPQQGISSLDDLDTEFFEAAETLRNEIDVYEKAKLEAAMIALSNAKSDLEALPNDANSEEREGIEGRISAAEAELERFQPNKVDTQQTNSLQSPTESTAVEEDNIALDEPEEVDPRDMLRRKRQLIQELRLLEEQKDSIIQENTAVQSTIAEILKKKRAQDGKDTGEMSKKNVSEQEMMFQKLLSSIRDIEDAIHKEKSTSAEAISELSQKLNESQQMADEIRDELLSFAKNVADSTYSSRTGKKMDPTVLQDLLTTLVEKDKIVIEERMRYLKLRNRVRKLEAELAAKEELGDGLHFIDFEQLKIENQAHNEKIEERNEELTKLRNKITSTIQVLTHLKEKLDWVEINNASLKQEVHRIEKVLAQKRDQVSRKKRNRDKLRRENLDLQRKCGLINQKALLRDFEAQYDEGSECARLIEELQSKHSAIKSKTEGIKVRLDKLKKQQPEMFTWN